MKILVSLLASTAILLSFSAGAKGFYDYTNCTSSARGAEFGYTVKKAGSGVNLVLHNVVAVKNMGLGVTAYPALAKTKNLKGDTLSKMITLKKTGHCKTEISLDKKYLGGSFAIALYTKAVKGLRVYYTFGYLVPQKNKKY